MLGVVRVRVARNQLEHVRIAEVIVGERRHRLAEPPVRRVQLVENRLGTDELAVRDLARVESVFVLRPGLGQPPGAALLQLGDGVLLPRREVPDEVLERSALPGIPFEPGAAEAAHGIAHRLPVRVHGRK